MKQYYESEILFKLMERDGFNVPSSVPPYESEIKVFLINQVKQAYPKLTDYEAEWLLYNYTKHLPADFPVSTVTNATHAHFENVVPFAYHDAILKGCTGYRDIDTDEILEAFEEGRNLELVSVRMPVLTTSNEDGTKTNILSCNEEVELHGIGEVRDELDCLTGELKENFVAITCNGTEDWRGDSTIGNIRLAYILPSIREKADGKGICDKLPTVTDNKRVGVRLARSGGLYVQIDASLGISVKEWLTSNEINIIYEKRDELKVVKTVGLTTIDENNESTYFIPIEGTMNVSSSSETIQPLFDMSVPVEATTQNLASFIDLEMGE